MAAKKSESLRQRLNSLFEWSADAIALLDKEGVILHVSRSTKRLLGYELARLVGRNTLSLVHDEDRGRMIGLFSEALARPGAPVTAELRMRRQDGVHRLIEAVITNHLDNPEVDAIVVNYRDVTERHEAAAALALSERRYRDLFESSVAAMYVTDEAGRFLSCNQALATMLGYGSPGELVGRLDSEFHVDPERRHQGVRYLLEHGAILGFEVELKRKDGEAFFALGSVTVIRGESQETKIEGTLIDVTERRRAETQARLLDRMKRNFMVVASHEMRSPLTVVQGYLEMIGEVLPDPLTQRQRDAIATARASLTRVINIVSNMTEVLAIEEERLALVPSLVDVRALAGEIAAEIAPFVEQRKLTLRVEGPEGLLAVADAGKLRTALAALVENAIKFTPDGGTILVRLTRAPEGVGVTVGDTGIGIEPWEMDHIFEKFYAGADPTHHTSGRFRFNARGPGLGLAVAKGYVEAHGGKIWAESEGSGRGAAFHIVLPAASET